MIHAECGRCIRERLLENRHEESFRSPLLTLLGVIDKGDTGAHEKESYLSSFDYTLTCRLKSG